MCVQRADFDQWLPPRRALHLLTAHFETEATISALLNRLSLGLLIAGAELTTWHSGDQEERAPLLVVPRSFWYHPSHFQMGTTFWKTGDVTVFGVTGAGYGISANDYVAFTGVRFDPEGLAAVAMAMGHDVPELAHSPPAKPDAPQSIARRNDISIDDAKRFSTAVIAGWPTATEKFAHAKALAFFPENKVPREWFLGIFRSIRGHKNPGVPPKTRS